MKSGLTWTSRDKGGEVPAGTVNLAAGKATVFDINLYLHDPINLKE